MPLANHYTKQQINHTKHYISNNYIKYIQIHQITDNINPSVLEGFISDMKGYKTVAIQFKRH